jgi:hypothetical protein
VAHLELGCLPETGLEVLRRAEAAQATRGHDADAVAQRLRLRHAVGRQQHRTPPLPQGQPAHHVPQEPPGTAGRRGPCLDHKQGLRKTGHERWLAKGAQVVGSKPHSKWVQAVSTYVLPELMELRLMNDDRITMLTSASATWKEEIYFEEQRLQMLLYQPVRTERESRPSVRTEEDGARSSKILVR